MRTLQRLSFRAELPTNDPPDIFFKKTKKSIEIKKQHCYKTIWLTLVIF